MKPREDISMVIDETTIINQEKIVLCVCYVLFCCVPHSTYKWRKKITNMKMLLLVSQVAPCYWSVVHEYQFCHNL